MPQSDAVIALLRDLVAIDSVNPSLVPGARGESAIARRLADELRAAGLIVEVAEVAPGRPNVVAVLEGRRSGPSVLLCGHTDTVGVTGMAAPFDAALRDGRVYGRGAEDMKGGLAAMVAAAARIVEDGGLDRGRLILAAVADEEHASLGAEALVTSWRADAAVVAEPTGLDVAVAHKGFQWVRVETRGRAAHGSRPSEGRDAILHMGRVLSRLEAVDARLRAGPRHALLGFASLHASIIEGGQELSSYPARASLQFERRTLPGEPSDRALIEVQGVLADLQRGDPSFDADATLTFTREPYEVDAAHPLPQALLAAAATGGQRARCVGMTFWTDAAVLGAAGIPAVIFGPGGAGLHSSEEYVLVDQVYRCRDVLVEFVRRFTESSFHRAAR
jgi:acetylornithine deacetylase